MNSDKLAQRVKDIPLSQRKAMFAAARKKPDVVDLGRGDPDLSTPEYIREAAKQALDEGDTHYTPHPGNRMLREAIARKLREENGLAYDPATEIIVTTGLQQAIYLVIHSFVDPGDEVLIPSPAYDPYVGSTTIAGGKPVFVDLREENGFVPDPDDLERHISPRTKLLVIISPNNPTGAVWDAWSLAAIAEIAQRRDLLVISDEIYESILFDGHQHHSIATFPGMRERTITLNGFSKAFAMTGWRIGYLAAPQPLAEWMVRLHYNMVLCTNSISQRAALAALNGAAGERDAIVAAFRRRKEFMHSQLLEIEGLTCIPPGGSLYLFPNIKAFGMSSWDLARYLLEEGNILTLPGTEFGESGEGYLRLSLAAPEDRIAIGMTRLKDALMRL